MHKCLGPKCKTKIEDPYLFCSFECAAYKGCFSVRTGFNEEKIKKLKENCEKRKNKKGNSL